MAFPTVPLVLLLALSAAAAPYTNQMAYECFQEKVLPQCKTPLQSCMDSPLCQQELKLFNKCSFDDSEQSAGKIFNGYCFKRWSDQADLTLPLLLCMADTCNLFYNSEMGVKELYQCSQWFLIDHDIACTEDCEQEMVKKIAERLDDTPLGQIYRQEFQNGEAALIADMIVKQCLEEDGAGRKMIFEEERLKMEIEAERNQRKAAEEVELAKKKVEEAQKAVEAARAAVDATNQAV